MSVETIWMWLSIIYISIRYGLPGIFKGARLAIEIIHDVKSQDDARAESIQRLADERRRLEIERFRSDASGRTVDEIIFDRISEMSVNELTGRRP